MPILNPALAVEAIVFQRWKGQWLGIVLTPWCMSLLLVPGSEQGWISTGENKRRFINLPAGDFAFLGSDEAELGEYQTCSLFSPMNKFSTQTEAVMTARASLPGLLATPAPHDPENPSGQPSPSRRHFQNAQALSGAGKPRWANRARPKFSSTYPATPVNRQPSGSMS